MAKKKYRTVYHGYRNEIKEQLAVFLAFHDYYQIDKPKEKCDCLFDLVKKITYIVNHKDKYKTEKVSPVFKTAEEGIKWLNS